MHNIAGLIVKRILLFAFLSVLPGALLCQTVELKAIFEQAEAKFKTFIEEKDDVEFIVDGGYWTNKVYKKGRKINIDVCWRNAPKEPVDAAWFYDGETEKHIWQTNSNAATKIDVAADDMKNDIGNIFYRIFKPWWMLDNESAIISGSGKYNGKDCYIIEFRNETSSLASYKIWVEKKTLFLIKEERKAANAKKDPGQPLEFFYETKLLDHKLVAGKWYMPAVMEYYKDGHKEYYDTFKSLKVKKAASPGQIKEKVDKK